MGEWLSGAAGLRRTCRQPPARSRPPAFLSASHTAGAADRRAGNTAVGTDRARFNRLVVPHLDAAYSYARFLSRDAEGAQDIVQEAALRAFRGFEGFQGGNARAWLFTIVRHCHLDRSTVLRRTARYEVALDLPSGSDDDAAPAGIGNLPSDEHTPEDALLQRDSARRVRSVLAGLQDISREILVLRELEALSYREIADVIGIPIGTVMSRLARARQDFAKAWSAQNGCDGDDQ
jgi:RNA polymerase sigma factor (sigma-70 family)